MYFPSEKGVTLIHRVPWFHPLYKKMEKEEENKEEEESCLFTALLSPEYSVNCT